MTAAPIPRSSGPEEAGLVVPEQVHLPAVHLKSDHPGMSPPARTLALDGPPASMLDLVDRTLADPTRSANATAIITTIGKSAARVILALGAVLIATAILAGMLIHFAGMGPVLGSAVAMGGTTAVAGGRYLWNRRASQRQNDTSRRRKT